MARLLGRLKEKQDAFAQPPALQETAQSGQEGAVPVVAAAVIGTVFAGDCVHVRPHGEDRAVLFPMGGNEAPSQLVELQGGGLGQIIHQYSFGLFFQAGQLPGAACSRRAGTGWGLIGLASFP